MMRACKADESRRKVPRKNAFFGFGAIKGLIFQGKHEKIMIHSSDRLIHVHSDIRGPLYEEALRMQAAGTKVLKLNTGNPARFGFAIPDSVRQATASHLDEAAPYCDVRGMIGARRAICDYHRGLGLTGIVPDDVFVCNGVSEAASMLMSALVTLTMLNTRMTATSRLFSP